MSNFNWRDWLVLLFAVLVASHIVYLAIVLPIALIHVGIGILAAALFLILHEKINRKKRA